MSEQSKFSGALAKLNQRTPEPPAEQSVTSAHAAEPAKGKGRPPGKRSDPDYQQTTVLLRKQTKKVASRQLEDAATGQDLSDLIEQLLSDWIRQKS